MLQICQLALLASHESVWQDASTKMCCIQPEKKHSTFGLLSVVCSIQSLCLDGGSLFSHFEMVSRCCCFFFAGAKDTFAYIYCSLIHTPSAL